MKKFYKYNSVVAIFFFITTQAQVGIGTITPSNSSVLELNSNNKGLLFNKIPLQSTNSAAPLSAHQEGMWVYNTATAGTYPTNVVPGLYYNDGTKWIIISTTETLPKIGDIKANMTTTDHNGWYIMDGRNTSAIASVIANQNAINLGYTLTIPNATDRILKGKTSSEQLSVNGGNNNFVLTQANLPNQTVSGTTNTAGAHTHTMTLIGDTFWNWFNTTLGTKVTGLRNLQTETRTTSTTGNHSHTFAVSTGGTATPINFYPSNMAVTYFIYLGK